MLRTNEIPNEITDHFEKAIEDAFKMAMQGDVNTGRLLLSCAQAAAAESAESWRGELLVLVMKETARYEAQSTSN